MTLCKNIGTSMTIVIYMYTYMPGTVILKRVTYKSWSKQNAPDCVRQECRMQQHCSTATHFFGITVAMIELRKRVTYVAPLVSAKGLGLALLHSAVYRSTTALRKYHAISQSGVSGRRNPFFNSYVSDWTGSRYCKACLCTKRVCANIRGNDFAGSTLIFLRIWGKLESF